VGSREGWAKGRKRPFQEIKGGFPFARALLCCSVVGVAQLEGECLDVVCAESSLVEDHVVVRRLLRALEAEVGDLYRRGAGGG
jgi:hypothetical protein